jgi:hypothetical protein
MWKVRRTEAADAGGDAAGVVEAKAALMQQWPATATR